MKIGTPRLFAILQRNEEGLMAHYGMLHDYKLSGNEIEATDDIRGASVYGPEDKKLGKIEDVIFDHSTGKIHYLVVDTGGLLRSKKFIVPPQQLRPSDKHEDDFTIGLTKEQIEQLPAYDQSAMKSQENWRDYESRYQESFVSKSWAGGAVQHREGSDHNVTPTAREMPAQPGSIGSKLSAGEIRNVTPDRIVPAGDDEVQIDNTAVGIGGRWSTFEDRLRQRRRDITSQCETCRAEDVHGTASERERDELAKAG